MHAKKDKNDPIIPKNAISFFEHSDKTGFKGLLGFKNLVALLKNESKKIQGEKYEHDFEAIREIAKSSFSEKVKPELVENIAVSYGYYFYHFLNSDKSPLTVEESKAVCYYRTLGNIRLVAEQLEVDSNVCQKHLKKGVKVLLLESTFDCFVTWVTLQDKDQDEKIDSPLASAPIHHLKQYLPKSLVFTLSTKGNTLQEVLTKHSIKDLSKSKGMGKAKMKLLLDFINYNQLGYLIS